MSIPSGPIQSSPPGGGTLGIDWETITRYDDIIHREASAVGWPIERVRATIAIESRGDPRAIQKNNSNGWSYGLMQVVPFGVGWAGWHELVREKARFSRTFPEREVVNALYEPEINIAVGVAILESFYVQHGTLDGAQSAFFTGNPYWGGEDTVNGTTGRQYQKSLAALIAEQRAFLPADPLAVIYPTMRPTPRVSFGFRARNTIALYHYGVGHGTQSAYEHSGIDVPVPYNTPIHSIAAGRVLCVGGRGQNLWGQGCGSFNDTGDAGPNGAEIGVGDITILFDSGLKWTAGHCRIAFIAPGDRVQAGQRIGASGGMLGPHTHHDMVEERNGAYWLLDPLPAMERAMGGGTASPPPPVYAERIGIPQPQEFEVWWDVEIVQDGVPLLQRASLDAPHVASLFVKGERFKAVYIALGNDGRSYWISSIGTRVPLEGTRCTKGPSVDRGGGNSGDS